MKKYHASKTAKRLATLIEDERRKIGELAVDNLSSPEAIERMGKLEHLINDYMRLAYIGK